MKALIMESADRVYERDLKDIDSELLSILGGKSTVIKIDLGLKYVIGIFYNDSARDKEVTLVKPEIETVIFGAIVFMAIRRDMIVELDDAGIEKIYSKIIPQ